jgi:LacI family transcriptional regulator, galactose operon repressor
MPRSKGTVSIRDVAAAAGVSVATVSRVLSPATAAVPMRKETRDKVERAIDQLGYRPNDLARALLQHRTAAIGLVVPDISNPYYPPLVRGVEDAASSHGYRVVLCNTDRDPAKISGYLDTLIKTRVDGIVVAGGGWADVPDRTAVLGTYRTGLVAVGRHLTAHPSVRIDNVAASRAAAEHLIGLGHRRIAFLGGPAESTTVQDRAQGYRDALKATGLHGFATDVRYGDFTEESGYAATRELLDTSPSPTALLCANDRIALGAYAAAADAGRRIPHDVSVVGFDDTPIARYVRPTLTTVAIPTYEMGSAAMRLLLAQLEGDGAPSLETMPTRLVIRDSAAAPAD